MAKRIDVYDFEFDYNLSAPTNGGDATLNAKTPNQGNFVNYYLTKDDGYIEFLSVYEKGLILHIKQTSSEIDIKSNKELELTDDGTFVLVSG